MLAYSCYIVMWLFSSILVPGELFLILFQRYVLTGSSSQTPNSASVSGENRKSLAPHIELCHKLIIRLERKI